MRGPSNNRKNREHTQAEQGFNLYFQGANKERADEVNRKRRERQERIRNKTKEKDYVQSYSKQPDFGPVMSDGPSYKKASKWEGRKRLSKESNNSMSKEYQEYNNPQQYHQPEAQVLKHQYTINLKEERDKRKKEKRVQSFGKPEQSLERSIMGLNKNDQDILRKSLMGFKKHPSSNNSAQKIDKGSIQEQRQGLSSTADVKDIINQIYEKQNDSDFILKIQSIINQFSRAGGSRQSESRRDSKKKEAGKTSQDFYENPFELGNSRTSLRSRKDVQKIRNESFRTSKEVKGQPETDKGELKESKVDNLSLKITGNFNGKEPKNTQGMQDLKLNFDESEFKIDTEREIVHDYKKSSKLINSMQKNPLLADSLHENAIATNKSLNNNFDDIFKTNNDPEFDMNSGIQSHSITLRINSGYHEDKMLGVTSLKIYDTKGKEIVLNGSNLSLRGLSRQQLDKVFDDNVYTTDKDKMTLLEFPILADYLDLEIKYEGKLPGSIRIWNYNADPNKGFKECNLLLDGFKIRDFTLNKAPGDITDFYNQDFIISDNPVIPNCPFPPKRETKEKQDRSVEQIRAPSRRSNTLKISQKMVQEDNNQSRESQVIESDNKDHQNTTAVNNTIKANRRNHSKKKLEEPLEIEDENLMMLNDSLITEGGDTGLDNIRGFKDLFKNTDFSSGLHKKKQEGQRIVVSRRQRPGSKNASNVQINYRSGSRKNSNKNTPSKENPRKQLPPTTLAQPNKDIFGDSFFKTSDLQIGPLSPKREINNQQNTKFVSRRNNHKNQKQQQQPLPHENLNNKDKDPSYKTKGMPGSINNTSLEFEKILSMGGGGPLLMDLNQPVKMNTNSHRKTGDIGGFGNEYQLEMRDNPTDILDVQLNSTLKNLQKFNKTNLSRMLSSNDDFFTPNATLQRLDSNPPLGGMINTTTNLAHMDKRDLTWDELIANSRDFVMPEMPMGKLLEMRIYSTWGDNFYVGLAGLEVFDFDGKPIHISASSVTAEPADLNALPDYNGDPRTVDKLVDGNYKTCDEIHSWLAPFYQNKVNKVSLGLSGLASISMIRLWNYNKSRIHSERGAKNISLFLDGKLIFFGEISQAPGSMEGAESTAECLLFSDPSIYTMIEKHDWVGKDPSSFGNRNADLLKSNIERPNTSNKRSTITPNPEVVDVKKQIELNKKILEDLEKDQKKKDEQENEQKKHTDFITCRKMAFKVEETWGDEHYSGLTGIAFYDPEDQIIEVSPQVGINASPRDLKSEGNYHDVRVLENLVNGVNVTTDEGSMWLVSFKKGGQGASLFINFGREVKLSKMKVWNYNKNERDTSRGIKRLKVTADITEISPPQGLFLRKAPGTAFLDFGQWICFPLAQRERLLKKKMGRQPKMEQFSIPPVLPCGHHLSINLLSTWGDSFYIGLNGIAVYDGKGRSLMKAAALAADPSNLAACGSQMDVRKVENLTDGVNLGSEDSNVWLAPFINPRTQGDCNLGRSKNRLFVDFCSPVTISAIRFWNYSKTPRRGVKEIEVYLDGAIIWSGLIIKASTSSYTNDCCLYFTGNSLTLDRVGSQPFTLSEGQPIAYSNEGTSSGEDRREVFEYGALRRPETGLGRR